MAENLGRRRLLRSIDRKTYYTDCFVASLGPAEKRVHWPLQRFATGITAPVEISVAFIPGSFQPIRKSSLVRLQLDPNVLVAFRADLNGDSGCMERAVFLRNMMNHVRFRYRPTSF